MRRRRVAGRLLVLQITALVVAGVVSPASAGSKANTMTDNVVTQKHTLFYNSMVCPSGVVAYDFTSWSTTITRVAGGNRDIERVRSITSIDGVGDCGTNPSGFLDGPSTYTPHFGSGNSVTFSHSLSFGFVRNAGGAGGYSSQKGYYTPRGGGPVITKLCTNVLVLNNGNGCGLI